ncbi:TPA: hypothetical protein DD449_04575 [Candidatus Berkelbacteria bacterium]|uniref:Uncharacterized protein n=1 Tax=Berkelbacteria bacterium GW2011_GWE1_39_12 TaxID=1618337 RepID=A0A0G4B439_9BACT|nr:MAG: hypothetical protein UT28_C0001G0535 [Berkelbacteria bacterium GW2011_GWE1_39_12]HBO60930.1 hypothetical protein [Candidatus Berkelbacteria bacterium]
MHNVTPIIFYFLYFGTSILFVVLLFCFLVSKKFKQFLKPAVYISIAIFLVSLANQILNLYFAVKGSSFGQYLLEGMNGFFWQKTIGLSKSYFLSFLFAISIFFIAQLVFEKQKRQVLDEYAPTIAFVTALLVGSVQIIPLFVAAFIFAIVYQLIYLVVKKVSDSRVSIVPFLILAALIIQVLQIFPFYDKFLGWLHII